MHFPSRLLVTHTAAAATVPLLRRLCRCFATTDEGVRPARRRPEGGVAPRIDEEEIGLHLLTKEIWSIAMFLMKILPINLADSIALFLCYLWFGNTSKYGLHRPSKGPIYLKFNSPIYPVLDAGTFSKIKSQEIEVFPEISMIEGKNVIFKNRKQRSFDAIILATGYRSTIKKWLKSLLFFL
ncbi:hypothetical protein M5K25_000428 [Dendrobium thyrsiflorum]|uniref:indole-3-pyruvate monooxygenase n=1 Tax=Dendrobium thyrsiflorum TaxID=117978 RepID=A0ABD0VVF0_DENTH